MSTSAPAAAKRSPKQANDADSLPPVKGAFTPAPPQHQAYHKCLCYGHEKGLPNYKVLALPRTNNYYAATGGCPCIPRAPAHPGSWRLKKAQMRSSTHHCGSGCTNKQPATHGCCVHTGYQYGWRPGPHTVKGKNTAATGKCDTFGNMAFKSKSKAYLPIEDDVSDLSSVDNQKLEDLEALILEEHAARVGVESDVRTLKEIVENGTADTYKQVRSTEELRKMVEAATEEQLAELLREVKSIVRRPLNQPNMELVRHIIEKQENLQRKRNYMADCACREKN